jgi:hypothetical protein
MMKQHIVCNLKALAVAAARNCDVLIFLPKGMGIFTTNAVEPKSRMGLNFILKAGGEKCARALVRASCKTDDRRALLPRVPFKITIAPS